MSHCFPKPLWLQPSHPNSLGIVKRQRSSSRDEPPNLSEANSSNTDSLFPFLSLEKQRGYLTSHLYICRIQAWNTAKCLATFTSLSDTAGRLPSSLGLEKVRAISLACVELQRISTESFRGSVQTWEILPSVPKPTKGKGNMGRYRNGLARYAH